MSEAMGVRIPPRDRVAHCEIRAGDGGADDALCRRCFRGLPLSRAAG